MQKRSILTDSLTEHRDQGSQNAIANISGVLDDVRNLPSGWRPEHFHISSNEFAYSELDRQREARLVAEYQDHLVNRQDGQDGHAEHETSHNPRLAEDFAEFAKDLLESDTYRLASTLAREAEADGQTAADADLRNILMAAVQQKRAEGAPE